METNIYKLLQGKFLDLETLVTKFSKNQNSLLRHAVKAKLERLKSLLYDENQPTEPYVINSPQNFIYLYEIFHYPEDGHKYTTTEFTEIFLKLKRLINSKLSKRNSSLIDYFQGIQAALDSHAIVSQADTRGTIISVNDTFCEMTGYDREELIGENHRILNSGTQPKEFFANLWETILSGQSWSNTVCNKTKEGDLYWVRSTISPLYLNNQMHSFLSIRTNITQTVHAQLAVAESEERFREAQRFTNIGTWSWDAETDEVIISDNVSRMMCGTDGVCGLRTKKDVGEFIHPDDRTIYEKDFDALISNNLLSYDIEYRVVWENQEVHWIMEKGRIILDENKNTKSVIGTIQDITARKELERELEESLIEAKKANSAKSQFLASMTHELRTPLNSVIGYSQLLQRTQVDAEQKQQLENIESSGRYLLGLINELLDLSSIETGSFSVSLEPTNLNEVLFETVGLTKPLADNKNIELIYQAPQEQIYLRADITRLKQVIINFISNAIKYNNPGGKAEVKVELSSSKVKVIISDNGVGIPYEKQEGVFEPFNRLGFETSSTEGTGIGLSITKTLIEEMKGEVGFESKPGVGTSFWFELPLTNKALVKLTNPPTYKANNDPAKTSLKVLYIEDNPFNMEFMADLFEEIPNHQLYISPNAEHGLEQAYSLVPDLIFIDINLPDIQGDQLLLLLQNIKELQKKPTVFYAITAQVNLDNLNQEALKQFKEIIFKPIDIDKITQIIENHS